MKTSDISKLKNASISAIEKWSDEMVDKMFPGKVETRTMMKNYVSNLLHQKSQMIEEGIDQAFLFLGDKEGNIDSDSMIDMVCGLLNEMQESEFDFGKLQAKVGKGQVEMVFPDGIISRLVFGDLKGVRITNEDIKEIKKFLNE